MSLRHHSVWPRKILKSQLDLIAVALGFSLTSPGALPELRLLLVVSGSSPLLWSKVASSPLSLAVSVPLSFGVLPHTPTPSSLQNWGGKPLSHLSLLQLKSDSRTLFPSKNRGVFWVTSNKKLAWLHLDDWVQFSSVTQLCPTFCNPMLSQHARPPCPSPTPRVHPNPYPLCR